MQQESGRAASLSKRRSGSRGARRSIVLLLTVLAFILLSLWGTLTMFRTKAEEVGAKILKGINDLSIDVVYYSYTTDSFRKTASRERFSEQIRDARRRLGEINRSELSSFKYNPWTDMVTLVYDVKFEKDRGTYTLNIKRTPTYQLDRLDVKSDHWSQR